MNEMIVTTYTDGSHRHRENIGACGFVALVEGKMIKHHITLVGNVSTFVCEYIAIINALQYSFLLKGVTRIIVRTDCRAATCLNHVYGRRKKRNPYFVTELLDTLEIIREHDIEVGIEHVKAHADDKYNNFIDQSARYQLRKYLKNQNNEKNLHNEKYHYKNKHPVTYYRSVNRL